MDRATLQDKFYGCIAGVHIGSSMGAIVEGYNGWDYNRIEREFGTLDDLYCYEHYENGWIREPGTTEDGVERQKLMITAVIEKQDRVTAEDVRRIWLRDIRPEAAGMISEKFEAALLAMARSGIPARDLGKYCDYAGLNSFSRSCHPIGLINAGDEAGAVEDVLEVGQLYQTSNSRGLKWACVTAAAIAAATRPNATADSVIGAIYDYCDPDEVVRELDRGLRIASGCSDFRELRAAFDGVYNGCGVPYYMSYANEVVTKGVCIFRMTGGVLYDAMIAGANMGRDTDCTAAVAAGIAGALSGIASMPEKLIQQVDRATDLIAFTNSKRTMKESADGLYGAFQARLRRMKEHATLMGEFSGAAN
ncbi:ADP-ribosylglycohydrolase family protein [Paenibacillus sp.]|uniref:ADP-ribosylglycohydrolase family protein n=1 Tax=Paenibacillus sp. TaxID=58172 RepID=UPI002D2FAE78|nr:ADP-ribosylglycohydrolase family protein [Paenibacillus sp.]HZG86425.1 ADP-ribosylglycohydrolase family protein [Paenibacillus sp.]